MITMKKILCPTDFSDCAEHAMQYALAFAQAYQAELHLAHIVEPVAYGGVEGIDVGLLKDPTDFGTARLKEIAERARRQHAQVTEHTATGAPFVEIIRLARELEVDLIVMGTHGRTGISHVLIGSCAERVVRKATCPVLTVKHPSHDFVMP
jgi:universal stress protein A